MGQTYPQGLLPVLPASSSPQGTMFTQGPQSVVWGKVVSTPASGVGMPRGPGTDTLGCN